MKRLGLVLAVVMAAVGFEGAAQATVYNIFFGGTCSDGWTENGVLDGVATSDVRGYWTGETTSTAYVTQTTSLSAAVADLKAVLDTKCAPGAGNSCWIFTHSNGGAVISKVLANYSTAWTISSIRVVGNNEGGSELAYADWLADIVLGCTYASDVTPTDNRAWNHNDTNSEAIYSYAGYKGFLSSILLPGEDDGIVAFHSTCSSPTVWNSSNCYNMTRWTNHYVSGVTSTATKGLYINHSAIKCHALEKLGGGTCSTNGTY